MYSQFEQYTQEIETRLNALPYAYRQSEVEEIRQHMQAMAESRIELGSEEKDAVAATLEQFGPAKTISRGLARAYRRRHPSLLRSLTHSTVCAVSLMTGGVWPFQMLLNHFTSVRYMVDVRFFDPQGQWIAYFLIFPLLLGALTAHIAPRQAREGAALSYGLLFAIFTTLAVTSAVRYDMPLQWFWQHLLPNGAAMTLCAAMSAMGAHASGQWRKIRLCRHALG